MSTQFRRREFIMLLSAAAAWPFAAHAQRDAKVSRIGFLGGGSASANPQLVTCLKDGLRQSGRVEGRDYVVEYRWADGVTERVPSLLAELVNLRPDVLVAYSTPVAQAARRAVTNIPIVFVAVSDPVASGIVASLARPGGNVTGVSNHLPATTPKLLEFLKEIHPTATRVVVVHDPTNDGKLLEVKELRAAGVTRGIAIDPIGVRSAEDIDRAFGGIPQSRSNAAIVLQDGVTLRHREQITKLAAKANLPAIYQIRQYPEGGGLMSYGLNYCEHFRRAGSYVAKVLKGMKPSDLPVELPMMFELVLNLKTAKALGITIPESILLRANEVIR